MWHTIRFPNSWQPWGDMWGAIGGTSFAPGVVDCASIGNDLHVVAIELSGRIWHTIRFGNSFTWQPWGDVTAAVAGAPAGFLPSHVACAAIGQDLHVIAKDLNSGRLFHTIRFPGSWQPWGDVLAAVPGAPIAGHSFDCASIGNDLHVVVKDYTNPRIWHTIRFQNSWQPWGDVTAAVSGAPANFEVTALTCAAIGNDLHVVVSDYTYAKLWHTIRFQNSWQPWGDVKAAIPGPPRSIASLALGCAGIGNDLHLVVADYYTGMIWHTIRFPAFWQAWGDVIAAIPIPGSPGPFGPYRPLSTACAAIGQDLHVVI